MINPRCEKGALLKVSGNPFSAGGGGMGITNIRHQGKWRGEPLGEMMGKRGKMERIQDIRETAYEKRVTHINAF